MKKKLSIIIPTFNEEAFLETLMERVWQAPTGNFVKELIVVDDGSTDKTREILEQMRGKYRLIVLRHERNMGKGRAVRTGLMKVTGEAVIVQDADLEYDPGDYAKMLKVYERTNSVVYGSRNLNPDRKGYPYFVWGVWLLTKICNFLYGANLTDIYTGYKLFPSGILKKLKFTSEGFEFEAEVTGKILKRGGRIEEVAVSYRPRKFAEGKKIRAGDGLIGLRSLVRERLT